MFPSPSFSATSALPFAVPAVTRRVVPSSVQALSTDPEAEAEAAAAKEPAAEDRAEQGTGDEGKE